MKPGHFSKTPKFRLLLLTPRAGLFAIDRIEKIDGGINENTGITGSRTVTVCDLRTPAGSSRSAGRHCRT
jgi:hypothetical protein